MNTPTDEATQKAIHAVLDKIDFEKISRSDVLADLISQTRAIAFRLLVGSTLLEEIEKRESAAEKPQEEAK